jgi:hypothetical protein
MNVIFDIFNSFFTGVCNVSVRLLRNECSCMITILISHIRHEKSDQNKCDTVNSEYSVRNSKYEHSPFPYMFIILWRFCRHRGVFDVCRLFLTPTRRVSWYPRRVIEGSGFPADYSLVVTCTGPRRRPSDWQPVPLTIHNLQPQPTLNTPLIHTPKNIHAQSLSPPAAGPTHPASVNHTLQTKPQSTLWSSRIYHTGAI